MRGQDKAPIVNTEPIRLTLQTDVPRLPVDLNVIKAQADETDEFIDDDAQLTAFSRAAVEYVEKYTGRALITRTYSMWLDEWPRTIVRSPLSDSEWWDGVRVGAISNIPVGRSAVEIPRPPTQSIVAVRTYDDADVATTFSATKYALDAAMQPARLVLRSSSETPHPQRSFNGIEIEFVAGYGDFPHNVPEGLRQAIAMFTTFLYRHKGGCPMPEAADKSGATILMQTYRIFRTT